jgi:hypothetical protein
MLHNTHTHTHTHTHTSQCIVPSCKCEAFEEKKNGLTPGTCQACNHGRLAHDILTAADAAAARTNSAAVRCHRCDCTKFIQKKKATGLFGFKSAGYVVMDAPVVYPPRNPFLAATRQSSSRVDGVDWLVRA